MSASDDIFTAVQHAIMEGHDAAWIKREVAASYEQAMSEELDRGRRTFANEKW